MSRKTIHRHTLLDLRNAREIVPDTIELHAFGSALLQSQEQLEIEVGISNIRTTKLGVMQHSVALIHEHRIDSESVRKLLSKQLKMGQYGCLGRLVTSNTVASSARSCEHSEERNDQRRQRVGELKHYSVLFSQRELGPPIFFAGIHRPLISLPARFYVT